MNDLPAMPASGQFPASLPEPASYYRGADVAERIRTRNAVVFLRTSRATLQQRNFANRVHHRHVLILVIETAGRVSLDGQSHPLGPGDALLVLPYQFHHYIDLAADALRWLFVTFQLDEGADQISAMGHRILKPGTEDLTLWQRITSLWQGRQEQPRAAELLAVLDQLLTRLAGRNLLPVKSIQRASASGSWIARVEARIGESIMQGESLAQVAARVGLSERHLRTRFEAEMGVSIRRYKANYQIHRAASLLQQGQLPMSRIAELSGFNSQPVFNRFIRRETGLTPSAWRSALREGPLEQPAQR